MPAPYIDNCLNYEKSSNTSSRLDVIDDCIEDYHIANHRKMHFLKFHKGGRRIGFIQAFRNITLICHEKFKNPDCVSRIHFSKVKKHVYEKGRKIISVSRVFNDIPSLNAISHPKIEIIDFITYIFGAMGMWIGFSFIVINPFKYFIEVLPDEHDFNREIRQTLENFYVDFCNNLAKLRDTIEGDKQVSCLKLDDRDKIISELNIGKTDE